MRRIKAIIISCVMAFTVCIGFCSGLAYADTEKTLTGKVYDLEDDGKYDLSLAQEVNTPASRFYVKGEISSVSEKNGFVSYAVNSGNLAVMINEKFGVDLVEQSDATEWHIISDKTKSVDSTKLTESIGSGAIVVQTSTDGRTWINIDTETDIYNKQDSINNRIVNGEATHAFYKTTNVQLTNGCYYRIIMAYKLQREIDPSKVLFVSVKNTEEKERIEVYQFYAYDPSVNRTETLDTKTAYEFGDVFRVDSQDGFKNPTLIKSDDPHIDWSVGKFYVSGYTDVRMEGDVPVFLKVPGDRAALWFVLDQELDKCNGDTGIRVEFISSGSDIYFGTPTIEDFGRGALIIRKTDKQNQKERQIYTNYLEASATVGANTRVDLFEEGDYEAALDYQLHYDKPFVFGTTTTKTLTYRIFFKFKVRNGDISAFIRDVDTNQFLTNANVAPHGFYIDVAQSQYLTMSIKREVLSEGLDGLVEDTKFSGVAKEGRHYTDEGIYTITINNQATGDSVTKRVYVGDRDILLLHMSTGMTIQAINERLASGAYIDENGKIVEPEPVNESPIPVTPEPTDAPSTPDHIDATIEETPKPMPTSYPSATPVVEPANNNDHNQNTQNKSLTTIVIVSIVAVLAISGAVVLKKKSKKKPAEKEDEQE